MGRTSELIVYERTREVYTFMISVSKQRKEIVHFFAKKWTEDGYFSGATESGKHRTIDFYIRKVKDTFLNYEKDIDSEKGRTLARLDNLYEKSIKIQDYKGALGVLREIADIVGFKAPTKSDITTKGERISVNITPEDAKL